MQRLNTTWTSSTCSCRGFKSRHRTPSVLCFVSPLRMINIKIYVSLVFLTVNAADNKVRDPEMDTLKIDIDPYV